MDKARNNNNEKLSSPTNKRRKKIKIKIDKVSKNGNKPNEQNLKSHYPSPSIVNETVLLYVHANFILLFSFVRSICVFFFFFFFVGERSHSMVARSWRLCLCVRMALNNKNRKIFCKHISRLDDKRKKNTQQNQNNQQKKRKENSVVWHCKWIDNTKNKMKTSKAKINRQKKKKKCFIKTTAAKRIAKYFSDDEYLIIILKRKWKKRKKIRNANIHIDSFDFRRFFFCCFQFRLPLEVISIRNIVCLSQHICHAAYDWWSHIKINSHEIV